jgi:transposase
MDRHWLAGRLEAGDSIEKIAREVGRHPSTVAYWVNKHGLKSRHAEKHAARGPLAREDLEPLVAVGMSVRQIARELERSVGTIRHWLRHYDIRTTAAQRVRRDGSTAPEVVRDCPRHGWTWFRKVGSQTHYRLSELGPVSSVVVSGCGCCGAGSLRGCPGLSGSATRSGSVT